LKGLPSFLTVCSLRMSSPTGALMSLRITKSNEKMPRRMSLFCFVSLLEGNKLLSLLGLCRKIARGGGFLWPKRHLCLGRSVTIPCPQTSNNPDFYQLMKRRCAFRSFSSHHSRRHPSSRTSFLQALNLQPNSQLRHPQPRVSLVHSYIILSRHTRLRAHITSI
jgi:hypothetical protein